MEQLKNKTNDLALSQLSRWRQRIHYENILLLYEYNTIYSQIHTYKNIYSRWYIQTWATILFEAITGLCCFLSLMPRPFVNLQIQYHKNYLCRNGNMISKFNMGIISAPYFAYYVPYKCKFLLTYSHSNML